ncbi:hypothetical protein H0H87_000281 [Tephrocybe sp. NHM501043]|nr:hypothetical protein H0H87_000281 [Tephrocybe sp. NHM501043]
MPAIRARKPLRERCNIKLNIKTAIPNEVYDDYMLTPDTPDVPSTPARRGRPSKRKPLANTTNIPNKAALKPKYLKDAGKPRLLPMYTPAAEIDLPGLHCLVPYVYVAFHKGRYLPRSMLAEDGALFTHVVKITDALPIEGDFQPGDIDLQEDPKRGMFLLKLIIPAPDPLDGTRIGKRRQYKKPVITERQLFFARDFLSLALPYYAETHPNLNLAACERLPDRVRLLITAPEREGTEVDIMAIAACYLAWASEEPAKTVVRYIEAEEEVPPVWKCAVRGKDAVELVERVGVVGKEYPRNV